MASKESVVLSNPLPAISFMREFADELASVAVLVGNTKALVKIPAPAKTTAIPTPVIIFDFFIIYFLENFHPQLNQSPLKKQAKIIFPFPLFSDKIKPSKTALTNPSHHP